MSRIATSYPAASLVLAGLLATGCGSSEEAAPDRVLPRALQPGDTIAFTAPASPLDRQRMELARRRLEALGYRVKVPEELYREKGYLAGSDAVRAAELTAAFRDPEVAAIFPGTGGYGCMRILDLLDYEVIRANPKIVAGFSDITALHLALQARTGLVSFHAPNVMYGLGSTEGMSSLAEQNFWRMLRGEAPADDVNLAVGVDGALRALSPGRARGRLIGGNLSLVSALEGTPYAARTAGRVLFLEDVGERPYRIDRMLRQLELAGRLDASSAVILGHFTGCDPKPGEASMSVEEVLADYFTDCGIPVLAGFPCGHHRLNATLPVGALVEVDADAGRVRLLECPVAR